MPRLAAWCAQNRATAHTRRHTMFFVRNDIKNGERTDLKPEFEASGQGLSSFLWEVIEREAKADGNMSHKVATRYILFEKRLEGELAKFAKELLNRDYRADEFLELILKGNNEKRARHSIEVTYQHEDYGDSDPTWLLIRW